MAITNENQIVVMEEVYKVYGKDKGFINTEFEAFYNKANAFVELFSNNSIFQVGDITSQKLFIKLSEELDLLKMNLENYTSDRRDTYKAIKTKEEASYKEHLESEQQKQQQKQRQKDFDSMNERWANIG